MMKRGNKIEKKKWEMLTSIRAGADWMDVSPLESTNADDGLAECTRVADGLGRGTWRYDGLRDITRNDRP